MPISCVKFHLGRYIPAYFIANFIGVEVTEVVCQVCVLCVGTAHLCPCYLHRCLSLYSVDIVDLYS